MKLTDYLRSKRDDIVQSRELLVENWSPTYGSGEPRSEIVEVIDFDALMKAIDNFSLIFRSGEKGERRINHATPTR